MGRRGWHWPRNRVLSPCTGLTLSWGVHSPTGPAPDCRPCPQQLDRNTHWKWVGSTSLLCLGQIAMHAREQILPWVDNIASRMVYYFSCSPYVSPAPGAGEHQRVPPPHTCQMDFTDGTWKAGPDGGISYENEG